jgi:hypothetical protein
MKIRYSYGALQRFAAADRMIHYVYCGERFVNPDGIGIVQVCSCRGRLCPQLLTLYQHFHK